MDINNKQVTVKIYDTGGEERFHSVISSYYKFADGVIFVFDITNRESFELINSWVKTINENVDSEQIKKVLVGNKIDLKESRVITEEEAKEMAKSYKMNYCETSAKENTGIDDLMQGIVSDIVNEMDLKEQGIKLNKGKNEQSGCGC